LFGTVIARTISKALGTSRRSAMKNRDSAVGQVNMAANPTMSRIIIAAMKPISVTFFHFLNHIVSQPSPRKEWFVAAHG